MSIVSPALLVSLLFCSCASTLAQDKIYFTSAEKDGKTEAVSLTTLTYTPPGKKPSPVTVSTKKLLLLFNRYGEFLSFEKLDFSNAQTQEEVRQFLTASSVKLSNDQVYTLAGKRVDDHIVKEDKKSIFLENNPAIDKDLVAAVIYSDGHHALLASADKAAVLLWENKSAAVAKAAPPVKPIGTDKPDIKKEPAAPVSQTETVKPAQQLGKDTVINPVPVTPTQQKTSQTPPLRFEDVAGNVSKAEFEKKALQKTNQLNIYLKVICNKAANYEEINKAIDQSVGLFVDENAMIETSSVNRNDVKRYKIRNYLSHIKLVNYDKIEIEWTNVQYVSDVKQGPDGNYYGVVSFEQVFRGYRDGKLIYQDVTRKNATVVLKTYQKNIEGTVKNVWDVLLSDIGVISTKSI